MKYFKISLPTIEESGFDDVDLLFKLKTLKILKYFIFAFLQMKKDCFNCLL
jgi:hypothetical protein